MHQPAFSGLLRGAPADMAAKQVVLVPKEET